MTTQVRILLSDSFNPWFNLAIEDWIFHELGEFDHILFLWRNGETVVIGRSQNPWLECHLDKMKQDQVYLARRQSGGGAVFHDLGNTNFTFLSKKSLYSRQNNFAIILRALTQFGIHAAVSGRNDLIITNNSEEYKISGSAFKEKMDRAFHHGTLLVASDLEKLQQYLNPSVKKLIAKGVKSVRSRVQNLSYLNPAVTHHALCEVIIEAFVRFHQLSAYQVEVLQAKNLNQISHLFAYYQQMQNWDWLYGQTLQFTHRFEERLSWGMIDIQFEVQQGMIKDTRIYSDSLYPDLIDYLARIFISIPYQWVDLQQCIGVTQKQFPQLENELEELQRWLKTSMTEG